MRPWLRKAPIWPKTGLLACSSSSRSMARRPSAPTAAGLDRSARRTSSAGMSWDSGGSATVSYWAAYERLVDEAVQRILWRHEAPEQVLPPLAARLDALREHP